MKLKILGPWKKSYDITRQHIKKQRHHFAAKFLYSQSYGFSNSHVWMWELEHKEGWAPKNWCLQTVVLGKSLESPLDCKEIKPVNPKGNQHWIFIGKTDAEAPILWPPDEKCQLIGKDLDVGEDWSQNGEGGSRGWNGWIASRLNENEFEQTPGDSGGQRILVCCSPWDHKESNMTYWLTTTLGRFTSCNPHHNPSIKLFFFLPNKLCTHFPLSSAPGNHHSTFCLYKFDYLV